MDTPDVEVMPGVVLPLTEDTVDLIFAGAEAKGMDLTAMKADIANFMADPFAEPHWPAP